MKKLIVLSMVVAFMLGSCSKKCKCTLYTNGKPYATTYHEAGAFQSCKSLSLVDETYENTDIRRECEPDE